MPQVLTGPCSGWAAKFLCQFASRHSHRAHRQAKRGRYWYAFMRVSGRYEWSLDTEQQSTRGSHSQKSTTISTRTDVLKYRTPSAFPRTVIDWNHLDEDIRPISAPTLLYSRRGFEIINADCSIESYPFSINARTHVPFRKCWVG